MKIVLLLAALLATTANAEYEMRKMTDTELAEMKTKDFGDLYHNFIESGGKAEAYEMVADAPAVDGMPARKAYGGFYLKILEMPKTTSATARALFLRDEFYFKDLKTLHASGQPILITNRAAFLPSPPLAVVLPRDQRFGQAILNGAFPKSKAHSVMILTREAHHSTFRHESEHVAQAEPGSDFSKLKPISLRLLGDKINNCVLNPLMEFLAYRKQRAFNKKHYTEDGNGGLMMIEEHDDAANRVTRGIRERTGKEMMTEIEAHIQKALAQHVMTLNTKCLPRATDPKALCNFAKEMYAIFSKEDHAYLTSLAPHLMSPEGCE